MTATRKVIALESRLKGCRNVITLGARPNFSEYSKEEASLIRNAGKIYYPTTFYADLFDSIGKKTFPSYHTYKCVQDKIKQTAVFNLLEIPHPATRVYYGRRCREKIICDFDFPFIAKVPRGSAMGTGVFLIKSRNDLEEYLNETSPAYIQEYIKADRDIRVVVIGKRVVHAYWRIAAPGEFRSNVAKGGSVELYHVPDEALELALYTAGKCGWDDVGIDIINTGGQYYVLEANMKYGKEGFRKAGIDYIKLMENMIERGEI
ncbi:MAG: ATP-grasp domain-containing protein [Deltaproteobacteria bacterium]|nr:ATP-grasp domain-containing protein [Deltaproteobacteria bacterium]